MRGSHLAVMLGREADAADWKDRFARALVDWSVTLGSADPEGWHEIAVDTEGHLYGFATLLDAAEAHARHPNAAFLDPHPACPFLGGLVPIGFVEWLEISDRLATRDLRGSWLVALIKEGKGLVVALDSGAVHPAITQRACSLINLGKYGFDDGGALLTRKLGELGDYLVRTIEVIQQALATDGATMHVCVVPTHHNVVRVGSSLRTARGETIEDEERIVHALAHLEARVWAYDFDGVAEWMEATVDV